LVTCFSNPWHIIDILVQRRRKKKRRKKKEGKERPKKQDQYEIYDITTKIKKEKFRGDKDYSPDFSF